MTMLMQRAKLIVAMLVFAVLIVLTILCDSPYEPIIEPFADIEDIWAIEDTRRESEVPLVESLHNHGVPLGYDKESNTFYCTLGLDQGENWPEIHLTADCDRDVRLVFVDDYSYDWCGDAIAEGYPYQILTYTDDAFFYTQIVFTGLPQITLEADTAIGIGDVPVQVTISTAQVSVSATAYTHLRGAGSLSISDKKSYKIDFGALGETRQVDVPGMGAADDIILLAGVMDDSLMRDRLSWDIYAMLAGENECYGPRNGQYVELFINERYEGVYLMMQPIDDGEELVKRGMNAALTDSVYRTAQIAYAGERPYVPNLMREESIYEVYHAPSIEHAFAGLGDWLKLERIPEGSEYDAGFAALAEKCVNVDSLVRYYLFIQAGGMSDNVFNNMYILAQKTKDDVQYAFAPWDMDLTWGRFKNSETGEFYQGLFSFPVAERILELDVSGARATCCRQWTAMRENVFTLENIRSLIDSYMYELSASGAYLRNSLRWHGDAYAVDGEEILAFCAERFVGMDEIFSRYDGEPYTSENLTFAK